MTTVISGRVWIILWVCLIFLNLILRIPVTSHEIGNDTFLYHALANSISTFGYAKWWINPLSIFGLYPYSSASATLFIVSGISQCTGMQMEWTIFLFALLLGMLSIFTSHLLAGIIINDRIFKFLVTFIFSTSQSILESSTWNISTRGLFIVLLPLFVYLLLKTRTYNLKYIVLFLCLFMLLVATHNLFYLIIPIVIIYIILRVIYKPSDQLRVNILLQYTQGILILSLLISLFIFSYYHQNSLDQIIQLNITLARYFGIFIIFTISGIVFISFKHNKTFEEWFLILCIFFILPFSTQITYFKHFAAIFLLLAAGFGLLNLANSSTNNKKTVYSIFVGFFLFSVVFSGYFQFWSTNVGGEFRYFERYMEESEYKPNIWINNYTNGTVICNEGLLGRRLIAFSEVPILTGEVTDIVYGLINIDQMETKIISPKTIEFYAGSPIKLVNDSSAWNWQKLMRVSYDDERWGKPLISKYNIRYAVENNRVYEKYVFGLIHESEFFKSLHKSEGNKLFDNGHVSILYLPKL